MSTFSKNLFDILGDGEAPRPEKEEKPQEVVVDKKNVSKINKDAARATKGGKGRQNGRPQRGRQFDRHSGTGIVDSQKKINKGWGKAGQSEAEADKDASEAPEAEVAAVEQQQEEEKVKTLDEYLAEKANKSLKVSLPEARKANDDDSAVFDGAVVVSKQEAEEYFVGQTAQPKKTKSSTEKVPRKVFVEIEQRFQEKPRPEFRNNNRRNNGGNNNRRNGGNNNRRNGGKKNSAAPAINLQDASAFPTLGATA
ncbi:MAG: hypothetical protein EXX96DRAFT_592028 [Benjaminiella poitrasii]|nr:MAG: hypothetical protein EXX96DRAFT_592028 [Benjaminiella poitrasii]